MTLEAKLWRVDADRPQQLKPSRLDEEKRLEDWLCGDEMGISQHLAMVAAMITMASLLSACGERNCLSGTCYLKHEATICNTEETYKQFGKELVRVSQGGPTWPVERFYDAGDCVRFPTATAVRVLDPGVFVTNVRVIDVEPRVDGWISSDFLR